MNSQALTLSGVEFQYPSQELLMPCQPLIKDISIIVPPGGMVHIQGSNGSGKTSLLLLIAGMYRPNSGTICYGGQNIWSDMAAYQENISYLGHKNGFNPHFTVWEHSQLDWQMPPDSQTFDLILEQFHLTATKNRLCSLLSSGQKRRLSLMRVMVSAKNLWLLDEPLVGLDPEGIAYLMICLQAHHAKGGQIIYSSHQTLPWRPLTHQELRL